MTAYVIAEVEVTDPEGYKAYQALVPPSLARHGGRFLVRGGRTETLEGAPAKRIVLLEFESVEAAKRWYDSPDYSEAIPLRMKSAKARLFIVEGAPPS